VKTYLDCIPCLLNHSLKATRAVTNDEDIHRQVLNAMAAMIPQLSLGLKPPEIAQETYRIIRQITGHSDPFHKVKAEANADALALYPRLAKIVVDAEDPLLTACKLAIAGNSIDLGPEFDQVTMESIVEIALGSHIDSSDYQRFGESINNSYRIMYIGDNTGEIVFDRLLIEQLHKARELDVVFVVRERPVINDVTRDDALDVGMDKVARIISSGSDAPAAILSQCSREMVELFHSADMIIAKGQGNYEALDEETGNIFFLLRAKCSIIADQFGVEIGDAVLKQNNSASQAGNTA
jgi:uncharacterized protein with ATP-grasp and redox domains